MEQAEIEILVGELETRIDRLRSLYDQYFMGIERLEPLVARKDVERRMVMLRKEQIRNTGLRFKFNVIIQRFNTYQTYWLRIARQIEQGTYRRDVMRATARFGVDPTKERAEESPKAAVQKDREPEDAARPKQAAHVLSEEDELGAGEDLLVSLDLDEPPDAAPAAKPRERFASAVRLDFDDLADPFEEHDPFPKPPAPTPPPPGPKLRIALRPGAAPAGAAPPDDDHRAPDRRAPAATSMPAPRIALRSMGPGQLSGAPPPPGGRPNEPRVVIAKRASVTDEVERGAAVPQKGLSVGPVMPPPPQRQPTLTDAAPPPGRLPPPAPRLVSPAPPRPPAPPTAGVGASPSPAAARPPAPPLAKPVISAAPPVAPKPAAPVAAPAISAPRAPASPPIARPPPPAVVRSAAPPPPAPPPPAAARVGDLSNDRFGQIYSKYVETRRERNEPTHAITRDALAKQLSESTERLKQKHGSKAIDFEVVVKDGKTILRPVVK